MNPKNTIAVVSLNPYYHREITKYHLSRAFFDREQVILTDSSGIRHQGTISSIQMEDGSGSSYIILMEGGHKFHVRAKD
jgi:hypothetical protein